MSDSTTEEEILEHPIPSSVYMSGDMALPLLTLSQEMHLLADHEVGTIVNNILDNGETVDWKDRTLVYEHELLVQEVLGNNDLVETQFVYDNAMPDVLPTMNNLHPPAPPLVSNEDYAGPFEFELYIAPQAGSKNPWVYSMTLNKLFIAIATPFPIDFKCKWPTKNMHIRATPVFSLAQHCQDLVTRCIAHATPNETHNKNVPSFIWHHVVRCQNANALYHGSVDDNLRLSVVVPLERPQTGMECIRLLYMFMCKNSCPSGMNRRPFEVVFTLEDDSGQIFGRHKLNIRVCSCPKRDKEKEEKIYIKETAGMAPPPGKKKKCSDKKMLSTSGEYPVDTKEYSLPWKICGKHNQLLVLNYCYNLMAGEIMKHGHNDNVRKCLDHLAEECKTQGVEKQNDSSC